ncbi:unnamed protein product [Periconia digitata]|uniref:Mitochondrial import receptor subunit n=1 Tax=Periconia digitata TaxID=1303443 RepID=A0A9W4XSA5_9PLEO|nr:unnamed protein product [Periconia digitata]
MPFELHIWGPAFGLPSIDPECAATVAYFARIIPQGQWTLIADYDTSISPQNEFPVLIDGASKTTGFSNIVSYLRNHHSGAYDLDYSLTHEQQTDRTAYVSFLRSTAGPLLDLFLYVSSENYNAATSSAYTAILPWLANYTIPPKRRDLARARTSHLGLSSLDVDEATEETRGPGSGTASSEYEAAKRAAGIPTEGQPKALNLGRRKGLGGLLSSPIYAARFKLDALSSEVFDPISDLLGKKDYLLDGDKPSSLDCLAFGYLSLMLYAPAPQAWLKEAIGTKYPRILRYIRRLRAELLGGVEIDSALVWSITNGKDTETPQNLPWQPRCRQGLVTSAVKAANQIMGNMPVVSAMVRNQVVIQDDGKSLISASRSSLPSSWVLNTIAACSALATAGLAGLAIHQRRNPREGLLIFWALRPSTGFNAFGEAESFLSVLAGQMQGGASM